ncbi:MAG: AEC family transporter [Pirellulales bacterium]|nr:AEC family transporter [Pirellulales bacterium]
MLEQIPHILIASAFVVTVILAGAFARWSGCLSAEADESILKLIIRILIPCLIFTVISDNPALRDPRNLVIPPLAGFCSVTIGFLVCILVSRLSPRINGLHTDAQRRSFAFCTGMYNYGYLAIPLIGLLFEEYPGTLGVLFVHNMGLEIGFWTLGVMVISGHFGRDWWRRAINPPSVAIVVALATNFITAARPQFESWGMPEWLGIPDFLMMAVESLGRMAIPLALVLIGATITDQLLTAGEKTPAKERAKTITLACMLRLCILPVCYLLIMTMVPATDDLKRVVAIEIAMPSAVFGVIMARHYGGDSGTALRIILATSFISILTIPIWISIGMAVLLR